MKAACQELASYSDSAVLSSGVDRYGIWTDWHEEGYEDSTIKQEAAIASPTGPTESLEEPLRGDMVQQIN